jgi:hypothetical protein
MSKLFDIKNAYGIKKKNVAQTAGLLGFALTHIFLLPSLGKGCSNREK